MRVLRCFGFGIAVLGWLVVIAHAQVTTANLRGTVTSSDDGSPMAEAEVTLVDEPSGDTKTATTNTDGEFVFTNLRVGGPYHVTATFSGFKSAEEKGIELSAGKTRSVDLKLSLAEEVIEVKSTAVPRATSGRTVVTAKEIEELPSVSRDPRDFVRRSPEVSVEGRDHTLSVGGFNTRFNSITIDGVRQDDDFGLNTSGYPTRRSPVPVSAIEELTVESAPFDVRYNKFLGGGVNIVTKTGTNDFHGEALVFYSSDGTIGNQTSTDKLKLNFREVRYGAALGGPIIKDRVHFFADIEGLSATTPTSVGPAGSDATNITSKVSQDDVARAQQIAHDVYGFGAGVPSRSLDEHDLKIFGKLDGTIDPHQRVVATYQRTAGNQIQQSLATDTTLPLTSNWYDARDTLNTFTARLFSDWTDAFSTQLEISGKLVQSRVPPLEGNGFMTANIKTMDGGTITLGPDEFRHANKLDDNTFHSKLESNYLLSTNLITAGVEGEMLQIRNLFVPFSNGSVVYPSLDAFEAQTPTSINYTNAVTLNPADAAANWNSYIVSAYAQDQVQITPELTLTGGLRYERYMTFNNITLNPNFVDKYGFANTSTLDGRQILMPRFGISYLPFDQLNLRAGGGLYAGGTPTVWVSNGYSNDGVRISSAFDKNAADINGFDGRHIPDALNQMIAAGNGNVDALDPKFKIPSVWKFGAGADYSFDIGDVVKSVELKLNYTYSDVYHGVKWEDLRRDLALPNNTPVGTLPDGRALYDTKNFNPGRGFDMLLTNDNRGYGHVASVQLSKGFPWGLYVSGSYAYQHVMEVSPATSSRSVSNYELEAIGLDPQRPDLATSAYERTHRFTASLQYSHAIIGDLVDSRPWKDMKTAFGLFVESRSGQPYSWTFGDPTFGQTAGKIFGESSEFARRNRELFYVPKGDGSDVILNGIDPGDFENFLQKTGLSHYRGQIAPRNAFKSPWYSRWDVRFAQDLPNPLEGHRARLVIDIENVGNLLNHKWGRYTQVPFPYMAPAVDVNYDAATGKYVYSNLRGASATQVDVLQSVWRMSLGLMYDF